MDGFHGMSYPVIRGGFSSEIKQAAQWNFAEFTFLRVQWKPQDMWIIVYLWLYSIVIIWYHVYMVYANYVDVPKQNMGIYGNIW